MDNTSGPPAPPGQTVVMDRLDLGGVDLHAEADRTFGPCRDPTCPTGSPDPAAYASQVPVDPPVTLTRRTPRFVELAAAVEARMASAGVVVDSEGIDESLRIRIRAVGEQLGVSDRTALEYAPDDVADSIAHEIVIAVRSIMANLERDERAVQSARRGGHLRLVR